MFHVLCITDMGGVLPMYVVCITNWPIEKCGRGGQGEGWVWPCTIDNNENKKVDASEIVSG